MNAIRKKKGKEGEGAIPDAAAGVWLCSVCCLDVMGKGLEREWLWVSFEALKDVLFMCFPDLQINCV